MGLSLSSGKQDRITLRPQAQLRSTFRPFFRWAIPLLAIPSKLSFSLCFPVRIENLVCRMIYSGRTALWFNLLSNMSSATANRRRLQNLLLAKIQFHRTPVASSYWDCGSSQLENFADVPSWFERILRLYVCY